MSPLIDPFIRGLAVGGLAAFTLAVARGRAAPQAKWISAGMALTVACFAAAYVLFMRQEVRA